MRPLDQFNAIPDRVGREAQDARAFERARFARHHPTRSELLASAGNASDGELLLPERILRSSSRTALKSVVIERMLLIAFWLSCCRSSISMRCSGVGSLDIGKPRTFRFARGCPSYARTKSNLSTEDDTASLKVLNRRTITERSPSSHVADVESGGDGGSRIRGLGHGFTPQPVGLSEDSNTLAARLREANDVCDEHRDISPLPA